MDLNEFKTQLHEHVRNLHLLLSDEQDFPIGRINNEFKACNALIKALDKNEDLDKEANDYILELTDAIMYFANSIKQRVESLKKEGG